MKRVLSFLLCAAVVLLLVPACLADEEADGGSGDVVRVGDPLPPFLATMADGSQVSPATLAGRPAVLVFFHTECADCQRELPGLQRLYEAYGARAGFVCISREEGAADVAAYWQAHGLSLLYCACPDRSLYALFAEHTIPRVYVADAAGRVCSQFTERVDLARLQSVLDSLLLSVDVNTAH